MNEEYRIEEDKLGKLKIENSKYWGIHTERAFHNFNISGLKVPFSIIRSFAMIKKACASANYELGYLEKEKFEAIDIACNEIISGRFDDQFPVDAMQGGAGTSINMNVNEVIANRAIEIMGGKKGDYKIIHPLNHVNMHQSTNDTYPTAIKIAAIFQLRKLSANVEKLQGAFQKKEKEFADVVTVGRTEMQNAVPLTLGMEFSSYSEAISRDRWRIFKCEERLRVVNLGGTAVGTGLTAPRDYIFLVNEKIREITGLGISRGENIVGETANADSFVEVSGIIRAHATNLMKICNDLRLLNFLGEIKLPAMQAGSSIMPGKINPVICEMAVQTALKIYANDYIVAETAGRGTLQINEFLPLLSYGLVESLTLLTNLDEKLSDHILNIIAIKEKCLEHFNESPEIITAFLPLIGYEKAEKLLMEFEMSGNKNIRAFLEEKLGKNTVDDYLNPFKLTSLGYRRRKNEKNSKGE